MITTTLQSTNVFLKLTVINIQQQPTIVVTQSINYKLEHFVKM